jgi:recombination protein RecT
MANEVAKQQKVTIQSLVHNEDFVKKAQDILQDGTPQFMASVLTLANSNKLLGECDPVKLYNCCLMAAALKLPFNQNLGQAYIVPFKGEPQLQIGWKGFVQLAQRSGQFKRINCTDVREGEITDRDRLTGDIAFEWLDDAEREKKPVIGYVAYFELLNGYQQTLYMSKAEVEAHAKKYSQTYKNGFGVWKDNFDAMARKTVVKRILNQYAPLSVDMAKAMEYDQADANGRYPDNAERVEIIDAEIGPSEEERNATE